MIEIHIFIHENALENVSKMVAILSRPQRVHTCKPEQNVTFLTVFSWIKIDLSKD